MRLIDLISAKFYGRRFSRLQSELETALGALDHIAASKNESQEYLTGYAIGAAEMIRQSMNCGGLKWW
jgi:hypothetical protein